MAGNKDKAFEGAEVKEEKVIEEPVEVKEEKKPEKVEKKDKNSIKVGDYIIYDAAHGKRRVRVIEEDNLTVTVNGDDGALLRISKERVKKD
ncbi:MAG: hypothetical protein ACI4TD_04235 [Phocaeicola sp.]